MIFGTGHDVMSHWESESLAKGAGLEFGGKCSNKEIVSSRKEDRRRCQTQGMPSANLHEKRKGSKPIISVCCTCCLSLCRFHGGLGTTLKQGSVEFFCAHVARDFMLATSRNSWQTPTMHHGSTLRYAFHHRLCRGKPQQVVLASAIE